MTECSVTENRKMLSCHPYKQKHVSSSVGYRSPQETVQNPATEKREKKISEEENKSVIRKKSR